MDTKILMVLDKSGSMASVKNDIIGGFNEFLTKQKALPDPATISVIAFDTNFADLYDNVPLADAKELTAASYVPNGYTALLDAVGRGIMKMRKLVAGQISPKVIVVIMTDGEENSSREHTRAAVKAMIEEEQKNGWAFLFIGANQDAFAEAGKIGIPGTHAAMYAASNSGGTIASMSCNVRSYRATGQSVQAGFTDSQREAINQ